MTNYRIIVSVHDVPPFSFLSADSQILSDKFANYGYYKIPQCGIL
jgi:hypothetical protein